MTTDTFHLLLAWATLLGVGGCNSTSHATSTNVLRPDIGAVPADLTADFDVFAANCSKCHGIERPLTAPVTDNHHWELYVAKMMRTPGSGISKIEAPHILRFLFWYTDRKTGRLAEGQSRIEEPPTAGHAQVVESSQSAPVTSKPGSLVAPPATPELSPAVTPETQGESTP